MLSEGGFSMVQSSTQTVGLAGLNEKLRSIVVELRQRLEALYGDRLVKMLLYGSQARGDARPWSDIDVLLVLRGAVRIAAEIARTEVVLGDLSLKYNVVISCQYVEEDRFARGDGPLLEIIRREGIEV
jgi:predicted nucleotidyltransferase